MSAAFDELVILSGKHAALAESHARLLISLNIAMTHYGHRQEKVTASQPKWVEEALAVLAVAMEIEALNELGGSNG